MSEPGSDLQFDRAQFDAPAETACAFCTRPLVGSYFELNGKLACETCRYQAEQAWNSSSGVARFLKATGLGIVAGILGALLYWGVAEIWEKELSLISIAVGWLIGMGVRIGSNGRGGWRYQLLAVFLTYTAIVGSYALSSSGACVKVARPRATKTAAPQPMEAPKLDGPKDEAVPGEKPSGVELLIGVGALSAIIFFSPFLMLVSGQGIIGLIIIAIGMWQAWSLNRRATLQIAGPFSLAKPSPPPSPSEVA